MSGNSSFLYPISDTQWSSLTSLLYSAGVCSGAINNSVKNVECGWRQTSCVSSPRRQITAELTNQMPALTSLGFLSPSSFPTNQPLFALLPSSCPPFSPLSVLPCTQPESAQFALHRAWQLVSNGQLAKCCPIDKNASC